LSSITARRDVSARLRGVRSAKARSGARDSRRVTEFGGVSVEPGRGIREGVGPYEYFTPDGAHVYLHDARSRRSLGIAATDST